MSSERLPCLTIYMAKIEEALAENSASPLTNTVREVFNKYREIGIFETSEFKGICEKIDSKLSEEQVDDITTMVKDSISALLLDDTSAGAQSEKKIGLFTLEHLDLLELLFDITSLTNRILTQRSPEEVKAEKDAVSNVLEKNSELENALLIVNSNNGFSEAERAAIIERGNALADAEGTSLNREHLVSAWKEHLDL